MAYTVVHQSELTYTQRPSAGAGPARERASLTEALGLEQSRANLWRLPAGASGVRHVEGAQEEVFLVLEGEVTMLLGEPPETVTIATGDAVKAAPETEIQVQNRSDAPARLLVWGAPPITGRGRLIDEAQ